MPKKTLTLRVEPLEADMLENLRKYIGTTTTTKAIMEACRMHRVIHTELQAIRRTSAERGRLLDQLAMHEKDRAHAVDCIESTLQVWREID